MPSPPKCDKQKIGLPCTNSGSECGVDHICLLTSTNALTGVCTCACTPDSAQTPGINEDTCPGAASDKPSVCGTLTLSNNQTRNFCFKTCAPRLGGNDCAAPLQCHPWSAQVIGKQGQAVCLYSGGCSFDADCRVRNGKACDTNDVAKKCTGAGETCVAVVSGSTVGVCTVAGKCDVKSRLCGVHALGKKTAMVGDPCKSSLDCAGNMTCWMELDESTHLADAAESCQVDGDCCSGDCNSNGKCGSGAPCRTRYRNGYCTISGCTFAKTLTQFACDSGSVCGHNYWGGACLKTCDLNKAAACRGNKLDRLGDYECRAWDRITSGGSPHTAKPVCESGQAMSCDLLKGLNLDCSAGGLKGNPTHMSCRDLKNNKLTNKLDPRGLCLDDTSSGAAAP